MDLVKYYNSRNMENLNTKLLEEHITRLRLLGLCEKQLKDLCDFGHGMILLANEILLKGKTYKELIEIFKLSMVSSDPFKSLEEIINLI